MAVVIPEYLKDLLEKPYRLALATVMPNGQPQVTPVWFMYDGQHLIINTARGRQKDRNIERNTKVTGLIIDPKNNHHWVELRGYVTEITEAGAHDVIKDLALRYRGKREFFLREGEVRVTYKIAVTKVNGE